jgi:hypothetical protein
MTHLPALRVLLEKAATDNGFDLKAEAPEPWLAFRSSHIPVSLWLAAETTGTLHLALSAPHLARELGGFTPASPVGAPSPTPWPLPPGAAAARAYPDLTPLTDAVRRAFQLARALPEVPLHTFEARTATLPRTTEADRLIVQRVGQDVFRAALLDFWQGRCPLTGLAVPELLRASHIKPWADCLEDAERLDVYNGLLLAPHLDAAFDRGFVTFTDAGELVCSPALPTDARAVLGVAGALPALPLREAHQVYMAWHRARVFRRNGCL